MAVFQCGDLVSYKVDNVELRGDVVDCKRRWVYVQRSDKECPQVDKVEVTTVTCLKSSYGRLCDFLMKGVGQ
jgi:hypothetical protein